MVMTARYREGKTPPLPGNTVKLSCTFRETITKPSDLGEHTQRVLEELPGMLPEEVSALETSGLVYCGGQPPPSESEECRSASGRPSELCA